MTFLLSGRALVAGHLFFRQSRFGMNLPINVDAIISGGAVEWERLEFKEGWNPEAILHTMCAFANDFHNLGGGYIFVGVKAEDGRPVLPPTGLNPNQLDGLQQELLNLGYHKLQPAYHPITTPYEIDGQPLLVIWCPGGQHRPYKAAASLAKDNRIFHYYLRKQSSTVRAKGEDERELLSLAARIPYDDRMNQQATIHDLQPLLIQPFLRQIGSHLADEAPKLDFRQLCRQMNLVDGPDEYLFPRNVGLLFFNEHPEKFFPYTQIDVVHFPDGPGADQFTEQIFRGPLHQMIEDALRYIRSTAIREHVVKQPDRAQADRFYNFPFAALEEAIVNAIYHRSYEEREPVEVRILPEEITITSYPGADRSISLEDLAAGKAVSRRYRNRRIGELLKELELTEGRGTGIPKIQRVMQANGSPPAVFRTDEDRSFFTVILPIHSIPEQQGSTQVSTQVSNSLNTKQLALLQFCQTPQDRLSIQAHLQMKSRKNLQQRYVKPLLEASLLAMTDPDHPNAPTQKYVTTKAGQEVLSGGSVKSL